MFLQASEILSTFSNISHVSAKVKRSTYIRFPTYISTTDNSTLHTQIVEPALGFTPAEICHAQNEPKLMVKQLLEIESCKDYIKTLIQTLDGIYVNQPKKIPTPCQGGKRISGGIPKRRNRVSVGWTPT